MWVNTPLFLSPTGSPLADMTPSTLGLRFSGWCDEKKSAPMDDCDAPLGGKALGEGGSMVDRSGCESMCSYISRNLSKSVGKKMSKYPGWTNKVDVGTVVFW